MFSRLSPQKLLSLRCSTSYTNVTKGFNRQTKTSKLLLKNENVAEVTETTSNLTAKCLIKPLIFTISFSGCTFVAASIWQYEEMRKFAQTFMAKQTSPFKYLESHYKRSEFRQQINAWWQRQSEGQKVASVIIGLNLGVFLLWRIPALYPFMRKYFSASPSIRGSCLPMFLSTFSHYSFFHLAANMYVLYSFSGTAVSFFGKEQFVALYCSAGVISSFTSYVYKVMSGRLVTSLGASGALMAVLSSMCLQFPNIPLQIIFFPFFTFSAGQAIKAIMTLDLIGLIAKWKLFDHAAHLGGASCGMLYLTYGQDYIWNKRERLFTWYHNIRERKSDCAMNGIDFK
ncbi:hypothetical protein JTE90_007549 [Oedothorax gibbosus]|uniref:rhomboid protease n=1 Tax=Oedothorax gibbosus TaxID=931172 RepID=A0AAV6VMM9_9ARAC|nr:hypothetical protein JTE90_007549 [Oedothorax gibbosus]